MGRTRYNKRAHLEESNRIFESRNKKSTINEQPGFDPENEKTQIPPMEYCCMGGVTGQQQCLQVPVGQCQPGGTGYYGGPFPNAQDCQASGCGGGTTGCDLSCVDLSDAATDAMVAQGGGPNSIQSYDSSASYSPGDVVCHLDPGTNVTNVFMASANSGILVPGGGPYPEPEEGVTAFPWPLPPGTPTTSYYWEPGVILASCLGTTGTSGCMDPSLPGYNPQATLDCSGNPPPAGGGYGDTNCCGMPGPQEYVCMGGVAGPVGTNTCTGPHPVGTYQMGQANVMGIYPTQAACDAACSVIICDPPPTGCPPGEIWMPAPVCACQTDPYPNTTCNFSWNSPCAQTHFGSLGGTQQSQTWLAQRETGYNSVGCQHLQNVVNWLTDQLNSGVTGSGSPNPGTPFNATQIARKTAKRDWAICQGAACECTLNVPPLTGTGNQTDDSHESITGTVCECVELVTPGPGQSSCGNYTPGTGFQGGGATHQCNGQMCTQADIGQTFEYSDSSKTLTFTLNSFSTPGVFGVSQTPGMNLAPSTCPTTPAATPEPEEKPEKKKEVAPKGEEEPLNEEINRMKSLWRHK